MADSFADYMASSPTMQMGLSMMRTGSPAQGLEVARQAQLMQALQNERQRAEQARKVLQGGITDEAIARMWQIDPARAVELVKLKQRQQQQDRLQQQAAFEQDMMQQYMGGGGQAGAPMAGSGSDVAPYIMAESDSPMMRGIGESAIADLKERRRIEAEQRAERRKIEAEERSPTQDQSKSYAFAVRMRGAEPVLDKYDSILADAGEAFAFNIPLIGNYLTSDEYQLVRQAQNDWITANLRKESGAVIGPEEMEQEVRKYFPVPGDSKATIEQKRKSRERALKGMIKASGPLGKGLSKESKQDPTPQSALEQLLDMRKRGELSPNEEAELDELLEGAI